VFYYCSQCSIPLPVIYQYNTSTYNYNNLVIFYFTTKILLEIIYIAKQRLLGQLVLYIITYNILIFQGKIKLI